MTPIVLVAAATVLGASARSMADPWTAGLWLAGLGAVSAVPWWLADALVRRRPVVATLLYEGSGLAVFVLVAGSAFLAVWPALALPARLAAIPADEARTLSDVILGAVGSLVGAAWLDEAKKPDGRFRPEQRQRRALAGAFADDPRLVAPRLPEMDRLSAAVYLEGAGPDDFGGWTLPDRLRRAGAVAIFA